jgi:hypothetical protein
LKIDFFHIILHLEWDFSIGKWVSLSNLIWEMHWILISFTLFYLWNEISQSENEFPWLISYEKCIEFWWFLYHFISGMRFLNRRVCLHDHSHMWDQLNFDYLTIIFHMTSEFSIGEYVFMIILICEINWFSVFFHILLYFE